jgi:hypothetical protein
MKRGDLVEYIGEYVEEVNLKPGTVGVIADYNQEDSLVDWVGNPEARVCCVDHSDLRLIARDG